MDHRQHQGHDDQDNPPAGPAVGGPGCPLHGHWSSCCLATALCWLASWSLRLATALCWLACSSCLGSRNPSQLSESQPANYCYWCVWHTDTPDSRYVVTKTEINVVYLK